MPVTAPVAWYSQAGGNILNGGGFDPNYGGTNYALSASPTCAGITIILTGTGTTASLSSSGYTGVTADQGNVCNVVSVTSGTATVGSYVITAATSTQWTFNQSIGTAGAVIVVYVGGSKASLANLIAASTPVVAGNTINRLGNETFTAASSAFLTSPAIANVRVVSSGSSWGDGLTVTLTISGSNNTLLAHSSASATGWLYDGFVFQGALQTGSRGANVTGGAVTFRRCIFDQMTNNCIVNTGARVKAIRCEYTNYTNIAVYGNSGYTNIKGCKWSGGSNVGLTVSTNGRLVVRGCLFQPSTGASSDHIRVDAATADLTVDGCTIDGAGRHGINLQGNAIEAEITNNLFSYNTGYNISTTATNPPAVVASSAHYVSGGSGETTGLDSGRATGSVTLTGDPYNNRAGGDYRLNNTSGAGLACQGAGEPLTLNNFATRECIGAFEGLPGSSVVPSIFAGIIGGDL